MIIVIATNQKTTVKKEPVNNSPAHTKSHSRQEMNVKPSSLKIKQYGTPALLKHFVLISQ
jgi:hypothetical protein